MSKFRVTRSGRVVANSRCSCGESCVENVTKLKRPIAKNKPPKEKNKQSNCTKVKQPTRVQHEVSRSNSYVSSSFKNCVVKLTNCMLANKSQQDNSTAQNENSIKQQHDEVSRSNSYVSSSFKECVVKLTNCMLSNKSQQDNSTAQNENCIKLRGRKPVTYFENSIDSSETDEKLNVPIYKQAIKNKKPVKKKQDPYQFDLETDENNKQYLEDPSFKTSVEKTKKNKKPIKRLAKTKKQSSIATNKKQPNNINKASKKMQVVPAGKIHATVVTTQKELEIACNTEQSVSVINVDSTQSEDIISEQLEDDSSRSPQANISYSKVNVLSNIQLTPIHNVNLTVQSPRYFNDDVPDAHSTVLNILSPWRFNNINIRRNPHLIIIKQSSLPSVNQEMVLDHTVVDNFSNNTILEDTIQKEAKKSHQIQKTILEYFNAYEDERENVDNHLTSLFDNEQFSPIKRSTGNVGTVKLSNLTKRKILGDLDENVLTSTPRMFNTSPNKQLAEDHSNFGFNSNDIDENDAPVTDKENRPFRLSIDSNQRKYYRRKRNVNAQNDITNLQTHQNVTPPESVKKDDEIEQEQIRLFDDYEVDDNLELPEIQLIKMKRSRKAQEKVEIKKKKDVRSKEEEEEAEEWAAQFNSMCHEIEQFPLEIE